MTDPIAATAEFLLRQLPWIRHQRFADEALADIAAAARIVRGILDGPSEQRFLGPCGVTLCSLCGQVQAEHVCEGDIPVWVCDGDVYGRAGATHGTCRTCGAQVDQAERRKWLDEVARDWLYTAADIAEAYGISVKTIRSWHNRGRLAAHGYDEGVPLHKVGEVLDLAAEAAARRETNRTRRVQAA